MIYLKQLKPELFTAQKKLASSLTKLVHGGRIKKYILRII